MTFLNLVNKVLRRLREDEVSTVAESQYSKLIGEFVNEAKEAMEDMWFWSVYETEIDTTVLGDSSTRVYDLTTTNDRSFMVRRVHDKWPLAFDVTSGDIAGQLRDMPWKALRARRATFDGTEVTSTTSAFALRPDSDGRGWSVELLYPCDNARTMRSYWYVPQDYLEVDGTDDNTNILLPSNPIFLGALMYAFNERGEEMGEPGNVHEQKFHRATAAAMELDMQANKNSDDNDMTNLERLRTNMSEVI
jgi:hypothetical protein